MPRVLVICNPPNSFHKLQALKAAPIPSIAQAESPIQRGKNLNFES